MSIGSPVAADVPSLFDVIINGKGYIFLRTIDTSLPFRTQRARYTRTPTFLERTNVTGAYSDNQQDFFLTSSQNDWSNGEDQRFFRSTDDVSKSRYWKGNAVDISIPGQVSIRPAIKSLTFAASATGAGVGFNLSALALRHYVGTSTTIYEVDPVGTITSRGAHGLGATPDSMGSDGQNLFISGGGSNVVRRMDNGFAFSTFSTGTSGNASFAYLNNTLYTGDGQIFVRMDTAGTRTAIFTWSQATGGIFTANSSLKVIPYGGNILILRLSVSTGQGSELWVYDGTGTKKLAEFPKNFHPYKPGTMLIGDMCIAQGIVFVAGNLMHSDTIGKSAIYAYVNGTINLLWQSDHYANVLNADALVASFDGGIVFTDWVDQNLRYYDLSSGAVSTIGAFPTGGTYGFISSSGSSLLMTNSSTTGTFYPDSVTATSGFITSSLMDFDNSLAKQFRGVKIDYIAGTDGNGGSVDIAYQIDSVDGTYTTLQSSATSGTEYNFTNISGHSISIKITLNKGTSTYGPILKRIYVRAAPALQSYRNCEYMLDCSGAHASIAEGSPVILNDNETPHPKSGLVQAQDITTAIIATTPFSITDRFGTYTGVIEPDKTELIEVSPEEYIARIATREV